MAWGRLSYTNESELCFKQMLGHSNYSARCVELTETKTHTLAQKKTKTLQGDSVSKTSHLFVLLTLNCIFLITPFLSVKDIAVTLLREVLYLKKIIIT